MKTLKKLLLFVVASALLAGCTSYKKCTLHAESRGSEQLQGRSSPL